MNNCKKIGAKIVRKHSVAIETIEQWKRQGDKIVFTNGCFDLLHRGHVDYLCKASDLGSRLVIGLNTDASVKRLKGTNRPIVDQQSRAWLLASLAFVDLVVLFDKTTPYELIKQLKPDVLVKGADYYAHEIAGYDIVIENGGQVVTIELVEGFSTSSLIEKIKNS